MNTNNKLYYLDYNATAPLAKSVAKSFASGLYPIGNPASPHAIGREALKNINQIKSKLFQIFGLESTEYNVIFHSGATEGCNTFLKYSENVILYSKADHPCVKEVIKKYYPENNAFTYQLDSKGKIDYLDIERLLEQYSDREIIVNFTLMHNETGVVQDLNKIVELKQKYHFRLHVDAVQSVGKMKNWSELNPFVDIYTFSGHKFGALKGIGFSFFRKDIVVNPLVFGGGQQNNWRSGTINVHGICSLIDALEEVDEEGMSSLKNLKNEIVIRIQKCTKLSVIENESFNTICFYHQDKKADEMLVHFDLNSVCVSSGSACSSGSVEPSSTLVEMGLEKYAKNSIRISLGKDNLLYSDDLLKRLELIFNRVGA